VQCKRQQIMAPMTTAEQLRSTAMPGTSWPAPEKPPKPSPHKVPSSTAEQMASSSMPMGQTYTKPPPETAGKSAGALNSRAAMQASSIFGDATPCASVAAALKPSKSVPSIPTSSAEQQASSLFGTPRYTAPPPKRNDGGASTVFPGQTKHVPPPKPETRVASIATSTAAQNASSAFGTPRYTSPPPQQPRRAQKNASDSISQNMSSAFGTPRYTSSKAAGAVSKEFAPGEMLMPTPRDPAAGAPKTKAEQFASASLPGNVYARPVSPRKASPRPIPSSSAEQGRSSVFGSPRFNSPPPKPQAEKPKPAGDMRSTNGGRNGPTSVFPNQAEYSAPPRPQPREGPPPAAPATKGEQYASSVFGTPRYTAPLQATADALGGPQWPPGGWGSINGPKKTTSAPPRPTTPTMVRPTRLEGTEERRAIWLSEQRLVNGENGTPRDPETKYENQISSVLGGSPTPLHYAQSCTPRHARSKSLMKVEFQGLPPDADTPRLHKSLVSLGLEAGVSVDINHVKVKYDAINGQATGKAFAEFRNVPDQDGVMRSVHSGIIAKVVKANAAHIVYDDRKDHRGEPRKDQVVGRAARFNAANRSIASRARPT
jgi:hypothetical protein